MFLLHLLLVGGCVAEPAFQALAPLPDGDPSTVLDDWSVMPPPPLTRCGPGRMALLNTTSYPTADLAAAAAGPGDTVWLCPGVHGDSLEVYTTGPFAIAGMTGDPVDVVVDGSPTAQPWLRSNPMSQMQIRHLTFRNFGLGHGAIMSFWDHDVADVLNVVFEDNGSITYTNALDTRFARYRDVISRRNEGQGLSASCYPDFSGIPCTLVVQGLTVQDQRVAWLPIDLAGEEYAGVTTALTATLSDVTVEGSATDRQLIGIGGNSYDITFERLVMRNNFVDKPYGTCPWSASLISIPSGTHPLKVVRFVDSVFEDNTAQSVIGTGDMYASTYADDRILLDRSVFHRNTTCLGAFHQGLYGSVGVRDADFGDGPDDNTPMDFEGPCPIDDVPLHATFRQARLTTSSHPFCP